MPFNTVVMSNGTEYRVLVSYQTLVDTINEALKARELLTVPMGISMPGEPKAINPRQIVAVNNLDQYGNGDDDDDEDDDDS
jgi:hypothetical protein